MKYSGSIVSFTRERNADIMRVFRQKLAEADFICIDDICRQVAESPASRFWVSAERAAVVISSMEVARPLPPMRKLKREMFLEIFRRYKAMRPLHPAESLLDLVAVIVNQPAPKFYYSPGTVREYVRRIRSGWYDQKSI